MSWGGWEGWLKTKMDNRKYRHKAAAINDIVKGLRPFHDLRPEVDKFDVTPERVEDRICCKGTIPVRFKGAMQHIPIKVWILDNHPFVPPWVYVIPTSQLTVKPGRYVDATGRVFLPYLSDWQSPPSCLHDLLEVLCMVFAEDFPISSRRRSSNPPGQALSPYPVAQYQRNPSPWSYREWSNNDVCKWFESIGMGQFVESVREHGILGTHLPHLSKDELIELEVDKIGQRMTILEEIRKLCGPAKHTH